MGEGIEGNAEEEVQLPRGVGGLEGFAAAACCQGSEIGLLMLVGFGSGKGKVEMDEGAAGGDEEDLQGVAGIRGWHR
uniref:Uncharacterized protein n=1 Tax=Leersia perrieri TaxID=77586 RepID=A0A0D9XVX2_9ORYZ